MKKLTQTPEWLNLQAHYAQVKDLHMRDLFAEDADRQKKLSLQLEEIFFDYSKNRLDENTIKLLTDLARARGLSEKIQQLFSGEKINITEKRAALHTALRQPFSSGQTSYINAIRDNLKKMQDFCHRIYSGEYRGFSNERISNIVNLGIGGSELGPRFVSEALSFYKIQECQVHFVSHIDEEQFYETLNKLNPATTLFLITSKSFTTEETLANAHLAKNWLLKYTDNYAQHFVAITGEYENACIFGVPQENIFPIWDWVGGRFSLWSSVGLSIMLAIGPENFNEMLSGANCMDIHFAETPFEKNLPVLLALISIWYINFFSCNTQAVLPYDYSMRSFSDYLQQLGMESNGKSVDVFGNFVDYDTCPILWGGSGCNGQHAYFQLLHQGSHLIPIDFLISAESHYSESTSHALLYANCLGQAEALMKGKTLEDALTELKLEYTDAEAIQLAPHYTFAGNKPSNMIIYQRLTPKVLGMLIALYEHKTFVQACIWGINPFDQPGIYYGKKLAKQIRANIANGEHSDTLDNATLNLIRRRRGVVK